ncbi:hypothetical protein P7C71_g6101, partial [Lecanoromycetidae sp. Uapishka_2]
MQTPTLELPPVLATAYSVSGESTPQYAVPHLATRRAACTHLTMERLYGDYECSICHRASDFGWVYSCVQDDEQSTIAATHRSEGRSSSSGEGFGTGRYPRRGDREFQMPTAQLSPWIQKAIKEGHYSPEQIEIMRAQKQKVVDTAKAAVERFEESQTSDSTDFSKRIPTTSPSVDANPHLPFPVINEVEDAATDTQPELRMFPHCEFRACQLCRPTFRDRTWQCFGHIFELEVSVEVSRLEAENRPLGRVSVIRTIGLRKPPPKRRPLLRTHDSRSLYQNSTHRRFSSSVPSYYQRSVDVADSTDIADAQVEEPESRGFRESVKRAFKSMILTRNDSNKLRKRKNRESSESTSAEVDAETFDMGLWQELNDELLREASSVPLPVKDSIDADGLNEEAGLIQGGSMEDDELLEGLKIAGVAVTEEAAETGTSDIIMSVWGNKR